MDDLQLLARAVEHADAGGVEVQQIQVVVVVGVDPVRADGSLRRVRARSARPRSP